MKVSALIGLLACCTCAQDVREILVLHPDSPSFTEAQKGILESTGPGWHYTELRIRPDSKVEEVLDAYKKLAPKAIVLMDNRSVRLYREALPKLDSNSRAPAIALLGVRIDAAIMDLPNSSGINYEIPAVTTLVNLRSIVKSAVRKAGIIYRASMEDLFISNKNYCKSENIDLVGIRVSDNSDAKSSLKEALAKIVSDPSIDALWVLNDNFFLSAALLKEVWLPGLAKWKHPIIVGVESLVQSSLNFGAFAVLPDPYALGVQAGGLLQELDESNWKFDNRRTDQPLSVLKVVNLKQLRDCCGVQEDKLGEVDKILE